MWEFLAHDQWGTNRGRSEPGSVFSEMYHNFCLLSHLIVFIREKNVNTPNKPLSSHLRTRYVCRFAFKSYVKLYLTLPGCLHLCSNVSVTSTRAVLFQFRFRRLLEFLLLLIIRFFLLAYAFFYCLPWKTRQRLGFTHTSIDWICFAYFFFAPFAVSSCA